MIGKLVTVNTRIGLGGLKLVFTDGEETTLMQTKLAEAEPEITLPIDDPQDIRAIAVGIFRGTELEGLKFYNTEEATDPFFDQVWANPVRGAFTEPQIIPEGFSIVGIQANRFADNYIRAVSFIIAPEVIAFTN